MKTEEELIALREEVAILNKKLRALTEEELAEVTGGIQLPGKDKTWFEPSGIDRPWFELSADKSLAADPGSGISFLP